MHLVGLIYFNGTECSETSAYKIQTPGNYAEENIQQTEHSESLKSINIVLPGRPRMAIWRMRIACRVPKVTNTLPG